MTEPTRTMVIDGHHGTSDMYCSCRSLHTATLRFLVSPPLPSIITATICKLQGVGVKLGEIPQLVAFHLHRWKKRNLRNPKLQTYLSYPQPYSFRHVATCLFPCLRGDNCFGAPAQMLGLLRHRQRISMLLKMSGRFYNDRLQWFSLQDAMKRES